MQAVVEKWTPERRRELTRTALVDAAAQVFARRGFHGASLEEIAETAGYTRGAIYKNFEDKEELFFAVIERRIEDQLQTFSDAFDDAEGAMDPRRIAALFKEMIGSDPEWFALDLEFRLYALRNPEARKRWIAHEREFHRIVARFIKEQTEAFGVSLKLSPDELAGVMLPASQGFWQWTALDPEQADLYATFLDLLIGAIVEDRAAQPRKRAAKRS